VARLGGYYGQPPVTVSILDGIRNKVGNRAKVEFAKASGSRSTMIGGPHEVQLADPAANRRLIDEAVSAARAADQIVLAIGDTEQTSARAGPRLIWAIAPAWTWWENNRRCSMPCARSASR